MTSDFRSIGFAPLTCAILGGVLTLGTVVGQHGSAADPAPASPMAGMDHSKMAGMDHSKMAGMGHPMTPGMDPAMPGMDPAMPGMDPAMPGMDSAPAAAADAAAPAMDMSAPGMAAAMPGGFHASCAGATCTVLFARGSTGTASVLGVKARLRKLSPALVQLLVDGTPVVLRAGRSVHSHGLTLKLLHADAKEVSIKFRKAG